MLKCQLATLPQATSSSTQALVDAGVPLEDVDEKGDQAIHYSAKAGSEEAIQFLLDKGVYKCAPGG